MSYTPADVKRLREETGAPMMECKAALDESGGEFERAKEILREKGQAAAAKRADRATGAGLVAISRGENKIAAVVVECETDFVAINPDFKAAVQQISDGVLATAPGGKGPEIAQGSVLADGTTIDEKIKELVGNIRENIQLKQALKLEGGNYGFYLHHDGKTAAIVELSAANDEVGKNVGMQVVSMGAEYLVKEDLPQERLQKEIEIEVERAVNEGKPAEMARKVAEGRVNKEFVKSAVLLEQPFILDAQKSVGEYVGNNLKVVGFHKLYVGQ